MSIFYYTLLSENFCSPPIKDVRTNRYEPDRV